MFKERKSVEEVEEGKFLSPKFDEKGLIPVITTDVKTKEILMHGYMNEEALKKTKDILHGKFKSSNTVLLEEFLEGEELSYFLIVDKKSYYFFYLCHRCCLYSAVFV